MRNLAYAEALLHYQRALDLLLTLDATVDVIRSRIGTTIKYVNIAWDTLAATDLITSVKGAEDLIGALPESSDVTDRARRAHLHRLLGILYFLVGDTATAVAYLQPLLEEANELGDEELYVDSSEIIGWIYVWRGQFATAILLMQQYLSYYEERELWRKWLQGVPDLCIALAGRGQRDEAVSLIEKCRPRAQALEIEEFAAVCQLYLGIIYWMIGDNQHALEQVQPFIEYGHQYDLVLQTMAGYLMEGSLLSRHGNHAQAQASMAQEQRLAQHLGGEPAADFYTAIKAEVAFNAGRYVEAITLAQQALTLAQAMDGLWAMGLAQRIWAQALAASDAADWDEIETRLTASLDAFAPGEARLETAHTHAVWGKLQVQRGKIEAAPTHLEQAAAQYESSGLTAQLAEVREAMYLD